MRGEKIGSSIGVLAGVAFVLLNAGTLGGPLQWSLRISALVVAAMVLYSVARAPSVQSAPPSRRAVRVYGWSVSAMVLAIAAGASVLNGPVDLPELTVVWVVAVVGAHFLPFASAFAAPVFHHLSWTLPGVAGLGAMLTLTVDDLAASWTAVAAGFVLIGAGASGARAAHRLNPATAPMHRRR